MEKGYIQIYTGNGKGKTTAAFGLALRALCAEKKVYIGQFLKGMEYSELNATKYFDKLTIEQFGSENFIGNPPDEEDILKAEEGLKRAFEIFEANEHDIVILDELNVAISLNLVSEEQVIRLINKKPDNIELIITGRNATKKIIEIADLVTEMKEIKHYYNSGVEARIGIEK